jgi:hypothetical protein
MRFFGNIVLSLLSLCLLAIPSFAENFEKSAVGSSPMTQIAQNRCSFGSRLCSGRFGRSCYRATQYTCFQGKICHRSRGRRIYKYKGRAYCLTPIEAARLRQQIRNKRNNSSRRRSYSAPQARRLLVQRLYSRCRKLRNRARYCRCGTKYLGRRLSNSDVLAIARAGYTRQRVPQYVTRRFNAIYRTGLAACARYR